jgi:hypothetical protein
MATYPVTDHTKASFKFDSFTNSLQGNNDYVKNRFNPYENTSFLPFNKEDEYFIDANDQAKTEAFSPDYPNFSSQGHQDMGFDMHTSTKMQDYSVDSYRINRSRGPSFNLGRGRKNSEDLFAHGFDLMNYFKNHDHNEKPISHEPHDQRFHSGLFEDFMSTPLMPNILSGNLASLVDNNYQLGFHTNLENGIPKDFAINPLSQSLQFTQSMQQRAQKIDEINEQSQAKDNFEPQSKKKRRLNNTQGSEAPEPISLSLKKSMSERRKSLDDEDEDSLQVKRNLTEKPKTKRSAKPKEAKPKKILGKKTLDGVLVRSEAEERLDRDEKSTEMSSNFSPNQKFEDLPGLFKSKSSIVGTFGHFKKPETAQELLGGLALPAEVEAYINNSKIFHQIKAPMARKIGTLTPEERRAKIEKYLEKRKRRTWNKRVNYDCRKKVADNRLRIKGRFVTRDQAFSMLEAIGIFPDPEKITSNEIKELLTERFGNLLGKKKESAGENGNEGIIGKNDNQMEFETSSMVSQDYSNGETFLKD